jgi:hypothetical protein
MLATFFQIGWCSRIAVLLAAGLVSTMTEGSWAAGTEMLHLRCTNPKGGANWAVVVDLDHGLVDSLPARITNAWISWHNPNGGTYELERATGALQLRAASSTGGYFLHYTCQPE